jgi:hypothetical protein
MRKSPKGILPAVAIIGEEDFKASELDNLPDNFLLVDPLDGIREFITAAMNLQRIETWRYPNGSCALSPAVPIVMRRPRHG